MPHFTQSTLAAPNRLTITISLRHLASHAALIRRLAQALAFPQPCPNASALDDLMRDLAWLPKPTSTSASNTSTNCTPNISPSPATPPTTSPHGATTGNSHTTAKPSA